MQELRDVDILKDEIWFGYRLNGGKISLRLEDFGCNPEDIRLQSQPTKIQDICKLFEKLVKELKT